MTNYADSFQDEDFEGLLEAREQDFGGLVTTRSLIEVGFLLGLGFGLAQLFFVAVGVLLVTAAL